MKKHFYLLLTLSLTFGAIGQVTSAENRMERQSSKSDRQSDPSSSQLTQAMELLDAYRGDGSMLETAGTLLQEILRKNPRYAPAHRELARYFIMRGHISYLNFQPGTLEAAEASLKRAIEINPHYAEAYVLAGHLYRLMKRPGEAKAALTTADALGTPDPWLQNNWADVLIDERKFEEAAQRYQKVIESGTRNKKAMVAASEGLTRYYRSTARLDEADSIYKKIIAYEPDGAWNYGNYAHFLLCDRDDYEAAIYQAIRALRIMNYGAGRSTLASALYRKWADQIIQGETVDAQKSLAEATAIVRAPPSQIVASTCGNSPSLRAVMNATRRTETQQ